MNARELGLLAILSLTAGYVDSVAFFGFGVFVANMTGNTVLLGGAVVSRLAPHLPGTIGVTLPLASVAAFVAGSVVAAAIVRAERGHTQARIVVGLLVAAVLGGAATLHRSGVTPGNLLGIALLSFGMGMQSVIAARAGIRSLWTTFVTGSLVTAAIDFVGGSLADPHRVREGGSDAGSWGLYFAGAVIGGFALAYVKNEALWPAAVALGLLAPVI